jgi:MerR family transcriptional regulator, thiopeptide resistance regulator
MERSMINFGQCLPLLVYKDIPSAHDFLVNVFGFEAGGVEYDAQGQAVHGEVRIGSRSLWLHRVTDEHELASPLSGVSGSGLVVFVDDVDAHFRRVRMAGVTTDSQPSDQSYGQREYDVRDPEGHRWWFAMPIGVGAAV